MRGTDGNDNLVGDDGKNTIHGGDGDDTIHGGKGNDLLLGGHGDDLVYGEDGNDVLNGGAGNDQLFGGAGIDVLYGGNGHATLDGGLGKDIILAGTHDTVIDSDGCSIVFAVDGHNKHLHDSRGYIGSIDATAAHGNVQFDWSALAAIGATSDDIQIKHNDIYIDFVGDHGEKVHVVVDNADDAHVTLTDGHTSSADHSYLSVHDFGSDAFVFDSFVL